MTAMATTRDNAADFAALAADLAEGASLASLASPMSLDLTTWLYDEATGLLTNKVYADGKGTAYTYTSDGQLASRIWARGVATTYAYTNGNMIAIDYSDSTPDVAFQYDRLGRQVSAIVAGVSTNLYAFDRFGQLTNEVSFGQAFVSALSRTYDALGRSIGFEIDSGYNVAYGYDSHGRFASVGSDLMPTANYSYLADSDLLAGYTLGNFTRTVSYEPARSLISSVASTFGNNTISQYDYANDALGRRTSRADSGLAFANPAFDAYSYNVRSEVTGAQRYHGTDVSDTSTVYGGRQFGYAYDPIGNRISASETIGGETLAKTYTANALNQYTAIANPSAVGLRGDTTNTATVTVNGNPAWRLEDYFYGGDEADNAFASLMKELAITAVYNPPGTNDPDVVTSTTGRVFVAQTPEAFQYDSDGNLTQDGRFTYTWDGENRLIAVTTRADLPASVPRVRVEYTYDHQARRIVSATAVWTNGSWQAVESRAFLYDGWNVVKETIAHQQPTTNHYVWGLDLSGTLQGAGGIGGLLAASLDGTIALYTYDANGNVGQLVSTDGDLLAHYEYSPFGETIVATGPLAKSNPFRFSTKHWDDLTGLGYWGYRYYHPDMGRWLCRDPDEALSARNPMVFIGNLPTNLVDVDGRFGYGYPLQDGNEGHGGPAAGNGVPAQPPMPSDPGCDANHVNVKEAVGSRYKFQCSRCVSVDCQKYRTCLEWSFNSGGTGVPQVRFYRWQLSTECAPCPVGFVIW